MKPLKILIIGANGQIGTELTAALRKEHGDENVIAADRYPANRQAIGPYLQLDVLDKASIIATVRQQQVTQIYLLAAMLSACGEQQPQTAWSLNMTGLLNVLDIAVSEQLDRIFWPSSIAVFGPGAPKLDCPQDTVIEPNTVYGISKRAGEYWCNYYFEKYGVDVRSLRYPGLISYSSPPGGGTTDYAVDIFHQAIEKRQYKCFLKADTTLPMMYMPDAIRATLDVMSAPKANIRVRTSYNLSALSFSPGELTAAIQKYIPDFEITYDHDFRQAIADSWPASINDLQARQDWNWQPRYDLNLTVADMLENIFVMKPEIANPFNNDQDGQSTFSIN